MFSVSTVKLKRNDWLELPFFFISSFTLTDHLLGKILSFSNDFVGLFFLLIVTLKKKHSVLPSVLFFDLLSGLDDSTRGRELLIRVTAFRILVHKCFWEVYKCMICVSCVMCVFGSSVSLSSTFEAKVWEVALFQIQWWNTAAEPTLIIFITVPTDLLLFSCCVARCSYFLSLFFLLPNFPKRSSLFLAKLITPHPAVELL